MSNYLNNLVARQLNRANLVIPRVPSLFEPQSYTSAMLPERSDTSEPTAVETVESETSIDVRPEIKRPIEPPAASPSPRIHSSSDEAANTVWRGRQKIAVTPWPPAEPTPDKRDESSTQVAAPQLQTGRSTPTIAQTTAASITTPLTSAAPREDAASPRQNVRQPSPPPVAPIELQDEANEQTRKSSRLEQSQAVSPRLEQSTIDAAPVDSKKGEASTKNSIIVQPRVGLLVENRTEANDYSLHIEPPAPAEPPPVINVTIGRIEVRATAPANTPRRREPSAKPVMSLDEYLRRRKKGGGE